MESAEKQHQIWAFWVRSCGEISVFTLPAQPFPSQVTFSVLFKFSAGFVERSEGASGGARCLPRETCLWYSLIFFDLPLIFFDLPLIFFELPPIFFDIIWPACDILWYSLTCLWYSLIHPAFLAPAGALQPSPSSSDFECSGSWRNEFDSKDVTMWRDVQRHGSEEDDILPHHWWLVPRTTVDHFTWSSVLISVSPNHVGVARLKIAE